eukprot:PhM_4_TR840/c0_g1_i1/m.1972
MSQNTTPYTSRLDIGGGSTPTGATPPVAAPHDRDARVSEFDSAVGAFLRGGANSMITVSGSALFDTIAGLVTRVKLQHAAIENLMDTVQQQQDHIAGLTSTVSELKNKVEKVTDRVLVQCSEATKMSETSCKQLEERVSEVSNSLRPVHERLAAVEATVNAHSDTLEVRAADDTLLASRIDDVEEAQRSLASKIESDHVKLATQMNETQQKQQQQQHDRANEKDPSSRRMSLLSHESDSLRTAVGHIDTDLSNLYSVLSLSKADVASAVGPSSEVIDRVRLLHATPAFHLMWTEIFHQAQESNKSKRMSAERQQEASSTSQFLQLVGLDVAEVIGQHGVQVVHVRRGSCAHDAGLEVGDTIVGLVDSVVESKAHFVTLLMQCQPNVPLRVASIPSGRTQPMMTELVVPSTAASAMSNVASSQASPAAATTYTPVHRTPTRFGHLLGKE